jgi:hypothetical protein
MTLFSLVHGYKRFGRNTFPSSLESLKIVYVGTYLPDFTISLPTNPQHEILLVYLKSDVGKTGKAGGY